MTETASEQPPEVPAEASVQAPRAAPPEVASAEGTPVAIWILYVLGILSAVVLAGSLLVVVIEAFASGRNGVDVHVSTASLTIWLALIAAAAGMFAWRRWGRGR